ncbi:MAG: hypothetical protein ACRCST_16330 [Turicibacter sp.]
MPQEKPSVIIETSYLLDLFCFIDLLNTDTISQYDEQIAYWEDYISDDSKKNLQKARKLLPKNETFMSMVVPLVSVDQELNILKTSEILSSPKYLIANYKKKDFYKNCKDKLFKQFINGDCEKVIRTVTPILMELEKAKFKHYWIHERLPIINSQIKSLKEYTTSHDIVHEVNEMINPTVIHSKLIYVLSFYKTTNNSLVLPDLSVVTHTQAQIEPLIQDVVATMITLPVEQLELKKVFAKLKRNKAIQNAYQPVKGEFKNVPDYCAETLLLAIHTYMNAKLEVQSQPYEFLARYNFGNHKLAVIFYHHFEQYPKPAHVTLNDYLKETLQDLNVEHLDQAFLSIMTHRL